MMEFLRNPWILYGGLGLAGVAGVYFVMSGLGGAPVENSDLSPSGATGGSFFGGVSGVSSGAGGGGTGDLVSALAAQAENDATSKKYAADSLERITLASLDTQKYLAGLQTQDDISLALLDYGKSQSFVSYGKKGKVVDASTNIFASVVSDGRGGYVLQSGRDLLSTGNSGAVAAQNAISQSAPAAPSSVAVSGGGSNQLDLGGGLYGAGGAWT